MSDCFLAHHKAAGSLRLQHFQCNAKKFYLTGILACRKTWSLVLLFVAATACGEPLPDMVIYGRSPTSSSGLPDLEFQCKVFAEVVTESGSLQFPGTRLARATDTGEPGWYIVRIPRRVGALPDKSRPFSTPGDEVAILIDRNGDGSLSPSERSEASIPRFKVSPDQRNIVRLDLDQSSDDEDSDGLPDAWEMAHFGHSNFNGESSPHGSGIANLIALAMGWDPMKPEVSSMPRLVPAADGTWFYEFLLAAGFNGTVTRLMEADSPAGPWSVVEGTPVDLFTVAGKTHFRQSLPGASLHGRRFYRLEITSGSPNQP